MCEVKNTYLLRTGVFGNSLCSFADGVLGQFTGQKQSDGCLNFSAGNRRPLVVVSQSGRFGGNSFENVVYEAVHDAHGLTRNTGVGMDLFQHFVNVDCVTFLPPALLFLVAFGDVLLSLSGLFGSFTACFGWHDDVHRTTTWTEITPPLFFRSLLLREETR